MKTLWSGFTRIYFNAYEEAPRFWSVDRGPGTPEIKVETVAMHGGGLASVVHAGSKVQPRAWLEGDVRVLRDTRGGILVDGQAAS